MHALTHRVRSRVRSMPRVAVVRRQRGLRPMTVGATAIGVTAGAVLEYLLDPDQGRARRARMRDRTAHTARQVNGSLTGMAHDLTNRGRGMAARARSRASNGHADDRVLHERVRAELGRHVRHAHAIEVHVTNGAVRLTGAVLADEAAKARKAVEHVPGVHEVDASWAVHDDEANLNQR